MSDTAIRSDTSDTVSDTRRKTESLDSILGGITLEGVFVEEVKKRTKNYMREQFEEIRDLIALIHLDHGSDQSQEECRRFRRVYELVLEKISETR